MTRTIQVAPPHSMVLIVDPKVFARWESVIPDPPPSPGPGRVPYRPLFAATGSCIVVGCQMFADGPTQITLRSKPEDQPDLDASFDGYLETPSRALAVVTTERSELLALATLSDPTRIRIWVNRDTEPDDVIVDVC